MGLLGSLLSATVKVALTPVTIVKDVVDIAEGEAPTSTVGLLGSALEDVADAVDDIV